MALSVYVIGSLRNPRIPEIANDLRLAGLNAFDDWHAGGPEADDEWKRYEMERGHTYEEALQGYAAEHVFSFDKEHLDRCHAAVLVLPAGRSGHLELGYMAGQNKLTAVLLDDDKDRWDVMYKFADFVSADPKALIEWLTRMDNLGNDTAWEVAR